MIYFAHQIFLFLTVSSAMLAAITVRVQDKDGKPIDATVMIETYKGRIVLASGRTEKGAFEFDDKKIAEQVNKMQKLYVVIFPISDRGKSTHSSAHEIHEAVDIVKKGTIIITLPKRMVPAATP